MCLIAIFNIVYLYNYRVTSDSLWLNVFYCLYYRSSRNFILYIIILYPICKSISSVWNLILVDPVSIISTSRFLKHMAFVEHVFTDPRKQHFSVQLRGIMNDPPRRFSRISGDHHGSLLIYRHGDIYVKPIPENYPFNFGVQS